VAALFEGAREAELTAGNGAAATMVARLETGQAAARRIADAVADVFDADAIAASLTDTGGGNWRVAIHFREGPDKDAVRAAVAAAAGPGVAAALRFELITATDWVRESLAGLPPVSAGRFVIHGAHHRGRVPINRIGIEIEAALAFGTGHHGTTRGCLLAVDRLCKTLSRQHRRPGILDLGTGSGVLAIAAARALRRPVLATDIDAGAVRVARANVRLNRAGPLVELIKADGAAAPRLRARAPFDLVLANILLGPVRRLAAPLRRLTARGGRIVLSGIMPTQANAVIATYRPFALERRMELEGWTTLVFARTQRHGAVARRAATK
jgi:ribosomal protein L11 methyltransferase